METDAVAGGLDFVEFVIYPHYLLVLLHYLDQRFLCQIFYFMGGACHPSQIIFLLLLEPISIISDLFNPQLLSPLVFKVFRPVVFRDELNLGTRFFF